MSNLAIPLLHVSNSASAETFFCSQLGFRREIAHRPDGVTTDPCYTGVTRDGIWLKLSLFSGDGVSGGVVNLITEEVDALHAAFVGKGVPIAVALVDQTCGSRAMYVKDADGNCIRFIQQ